MTSKSLDKFYTKSNIAESLIYLIPNLELYDTILEPSAGSGTFSNVLSSIHENVIAVDIQPDDDSIIKLNFLSDFIEFEGDTIVVGNPPFGRNSSLAIKFFNRAASYQNVSCIAFILPKSFKKISMKNKLDLNFKLVSSVDIENNAFTLDGQEYNVPTVFQIWKRDDIPRIKYYSPSLNHYFHFVKYEEISSSNEEEIIAIQRVGGNAGLASRFNEQNKQSHYFLICTSVFFFADQIIDYLNSIEWEHNDTIGPKSISKYQFIIELNKLIPSE